MSKFTFSDDDIIIMLDLYGAKGSDKDSTAKALRSLGDDYEQLERAAVVTTYKYYECGKPNKAVKPRMSREEAIKMVGRKGWLSGLVRSTFHWGCSRETLDGKGYVEFDSRKLFK